MMLNQDAVGKESTILDENYVMNIEQGIINKEGRHNIPFSFIIPCSSIGYFTPRSIFF